MGIRLDITGNTKLAGLVGGATITHSSSPTMHTASFKEVGVDAVYLSFPAELESLEAMVDGLEKVAIGYNVTMPFKTHICKYMDGLSPAAELMGAVNTVEIRDGKSYGHNTDGAGFVENIRSLGFEPKGKVATIIGAGGAGSAVFTQLALEGVKKINIFNMRDEFWEATQQRIQNLSERTGVPVELHDLENKQELKEAIAESDLLANATRVGAGDLEGQSNVDPDMLHDNLFVADTVYNPEETKLIQMAKEKGLSTAPGIGMLLQQAALAEKIWLGIDMPIEYIRNNFF